MEDNCAVVGRWTTISITEFPFSNTTMESALEKQRRDCSSGSEQDEETSKQENFRIGFELYFIYIYVSLGEVNLP